MAAITWFELAWLVKNERVAVDIPLRSWLDGLSRTVRTAAVTPAIADFAVSLPPSFSSDPADRMIFATAVEHGWPLITKDRRLRSHDHPRSQAVW